MKRVGRDATLDEASVRESEQRAADWKRPVTRAPRAASNPVTTITVHPDVWAAALRLAGGIASRIEVRSETDVTVHNAPWRTNKKGILP
jgi:hypothetical protein